MLYTNGRLLYFTLYLEFVVRHHGFSRVIFGGFVTILSELRFLNGFGKQNQCK